MIDLRRFEPDFGQGSNLAISLIVVGIMVVLLIGVIDLSALPNHYAFAVAFGAAGLAKHLAFRKRRVERRGVQLLDLNRRA